jgi:hypothetical protein
MTGYEKQSDAELQETMSQWQQIRYSSEKKSAWFCISSILIGGGVLVASLSQGINLFFLTLGVVAIGLFIKYKSEKKLYESSVEETELISEEQERRSVNWVLDISESRISNSHRSRFYPSEKSWTKSPAWAFEIPTCEFKDVEVDSVIELQCEPEIEGNENIRLLVPVYFLTRHFDSFHFREDKKTISLFLSADPKNEFVEIRGKDEIDFSSFKKTKSLSQPEP